MTQIFRVAFLTALSLVNCRSVSAAHQGSVFALSATLPLLWSFVPALSAEEDAGKNAEVAEGDGAAVAEGGGGDTDTKANEIMEDGFMKEMDKDGDGFLSLEEMISDSDGDPIDAESKEMITGVFQSADEDKDGKLSVAELPKLFKEFDEMNPDLEDDASGSKDGSK